MEKYNRIKFSHVNLLLFQYGRDLVLWIHKQIHNKLQILSLISSAVSAHMLL